ncbi:MAG: hypothetical protein NZL83_01075 [Candidatus Absconditabacterales bacterium]|nr:hypothetical protein [Candidatus Absconditabacterales bacterium]
MAYLVCDNLVPDVLAGLESMDIQTGQSVSIFLVFRRCILGLIIW